MSTAHIGSERPVELLQSVGGEMRLGGSSPGVTPDGTHTTPETLYDVHQLNEKVRGRSRHWKIIQSTSCCFLLYSYNKIYPVEIVDKKYVEIALLFF